MSMNKLLHYYATARPQMTAVECEQIVREASEGDIYCALMTARVAREQAEVLKARAKELRDQRLPA